MMPNRVWKFVAAVGAAAVMCTVAVPAQSKFTLKVHTGRGQIGYDVNSTMIIARRAAHGRRE